MLHNKPLVLGVLRGTIYDFDDAGDELERHTHTEQDVHISSVARGAFKVFGDGWETEAKSGAILDWEPGVYHGFVALEPNSRLVNVIKGVT